MKSQLFCFSVLVASALFLFHTPVNSALTTINDSNSSEANLVNSVPGGKTNPVLNTSIMDFLYGSGNYVRIDDSKDQVWHSDQTGEVQVMAKFAGNSQDLGFYDNASGSSPMHMMMSVSGSEYSVIGSNTFSPTDLFRFGLQTSPSQGTQLLSSLVSDNPDHLDHMVTFLITGQNGGFTNNVVGDYVIAFEDMMVPQSDRDFNDAVFQISHAAPAPEPSTYLMLGSLLMVGAFLKGRKTSLILSKI